MKSDDLKNRIIHIGNDLEEIRIKELAKIMLKLMDKDCKIETLNAPLGSVDRRCPDIGLLKTIGFIPKVMLKEGVEKTINWYKK